MTSCLWALPVMLLLAVVPKCESGRVLVFPVDGSHWLNMRVLVEALHERGHELTVMRTSTSWYISEHSPLYTSITIPQEKPTNIEDQDTMSDFLRETIEVRRGEGSPLAFIALYQNLFNMLRQNQAAVANLTSTILEDKSLMARLREAQYDLVLTDPVFPAGVILAHYLQLPLVLNVRWLLSGEAHFALAPSPLSYIPDIFSRLSDKMTFWQRVSNVFYHSLTNYMYRFISSPPYQEVCERHLGPDVDIMSLIQGADIWLMRMDFVFEFPRPTMPNVVYIGGFHCKPAKPLPAELEEFVQSSGEHGVVIMSLGSLLGGLGPEISEVIASAFARLPQKVVWRHIGQRPSLLGNNTLLVEWLPQNDLLAHPKARAFVTHGGTNGIYEAIYHGVPILGLPLIFDQFDNLVRLTARGAAKTLEVTTLEVESMTQALRDILDDQMPYRQNMQRLMQLHRDTPLKPLDSALFWLEFVMRHKGASHLHTESYKMPWYEYHSVDVFALLLSCTVVFSLFISVSCRFLCKTLRQKKKSKHE